MVPFELTYGSTTYVINHINPALFDGVHTFMGGALTKLVIMHNSIITGM
jgi:hypothetical protein